MSGPPRNGGRLTTHARGVAQEPMPNSMASVVTVPKPAGSVGSRCHHWPRTIWPGTRLESAPLWRKALKSRLNVPLQWLRSSEAALGVSNGYAKPVQLGNDRWAALLAARQLTRDACLVVMAGTATTVDGLDARGRFCGGLILPGLSLMRQALAGGTAQLPLAVGAYQPWPDNTDDAITTGSLLATAGAIAAQRAQLEARAEMTGRGEGVACLLSGGAAEALRPHIAGPLMVIPELVLEGVARFACAADA